MKSFFFIIIVLIYFTGCDSNSLLDGTYCAEVDRYNPKTGKQSSYTLTVEIEDNKIVQINYPNGGYSDSGEFKPAKISNRSASFSDFDDVQFSVDVFKKGADCFSNVAKAYQCASSTKSGKRCKNKTDNKDGRCHLH